MAQTKTVQSRLAHFSSDGQLLSELGERLIASAHVALAELVKNAYDADASTCHVWVAEERKSKVLHVWDNGHGMTEREFLQFWMTIATSAKLNKDASRRYNRPITGSKGVGRFAVRFLGNYLRLETVALDAKSNEYKKLTAAFDWGKFKAGLGLDRVPIPYTVGVGYTADDRGARLTIHDLREDWSDNRLKTLTGAVLDLISPPFAPLQTQIPGGATRDPGFSLFFCEPGQEGESASATSEILERYVGRVSITVRGREVAYQYDYGDAKPHTVRRKLAGENLIGEVLGEIRYFPRRPGVFLGLKTMDGREATRWLRDHGGVRVIDRHFRLLPYGEPDDDWLSISAAKATNRREWGSTVARALYPEEERNKRETEDPLLKVPANHQLVGAVHVQSHRPRPGAPAPEDARRLQPAMDRQGFVENEGYYQLKDTVLGAIELLAVVDVEETAKQRAKEARRETLAAKQQIVAAIKRVHASPEITAREKRRIIESYENLGAQVSRMETAHMEARRAVETMSLLGVLAGFMTHEAAVMLRSSERMLAKWRRAPHSLRDDEYGELVQATEEAIHQIKGHLDYSRAFVGNIRATRAEPFKVRGQVNVIIGQLDRFTRPRTIRVDNAVDASQMSPRVAVSIYSGILLNLYTNAIKAVLQLRDTSRDKVVRIEAYDTDKGHVLRVMDTGVGIPVEIQDRIFDPLFSTTSVEGPLGSGMGLGLHIVRRLLTELRGQIRLVEPPDGFITCFEVRFGT